MQYQITGKHMDVGEALRTYVTDAMQAVVEKYAQRPTDANVVFSKRGHEFRCEATLHLSTGLTAQAHAAEHEVYGAFDQCCEKMEKQLRRYKRRLKDHHRDRAQPVEAEGAAYYVMAADGDGAADEPQTLEPMIIAEMETRIPSISVGEAVMQMELKGAPILVFRNETSSGVNVVYRRDDGNIGWIDPGGTR
ncbi:MAG: ribosome-associated translation inhibitor RaiA [Rhodobacteraceae bacterium]|nr:ribosome-associated translation inhibitor RaiA [Paracoccaceae bacterium]